MKKPFYTRKFFKVVMKYIVLGVLSSLITMTVLIVNQNPEVLSKFKISMPSFGSRQPKIDMTNPQIVRLRNMIKSAFNHYFGTCKIYDEVYINRRKCINTYGIRASLVEAMPVLYQFGLREEYDLAFEYLKANYLVKNFKWVNRHEYWSRGVASMIESFLITKNKFYKNLAIQMADQMLKYEETGIKQCDFINLQNGQCNNHKWQNGTSISGIIAGLPEILALYQLTQDKKYMNHAENIFLRIPPNQQLNSAYMEDGSGVGPYDLDGYKISFLHNLALALTFVDNEDQSSFIMEAISYIQNEINPHAYSAYPLLDTIKYFEFADIPAMFPADESLKKNVIEAYSKPDYLAFSLTDRLSGTTGFNFESAGLRELARLTVDDKESDDAFLAVLIEGLQKTKYGQGFSSIRKSSIGKASLSYIQTSNLFGQWANVAAWAATGNLNYVNTSAINERGHILRLKVPVKQQK